MVRAVVLTTLLLLGTGGLRPAHTACRSHWRVLSSARYCVVCLPSPQAALCRAVHGVANDNRALRTATPALW